MRRYYLYLVATAILTSCSFDLPHESPFDPFSPAGKQAKAALSGLVVLEGEVSAPDVKIELTGDRSYESTTGEDGRFAVAGIVPGSYQVRYATDYFETFEETIDIGLGETLDLGERKLPAKRTRVSGNAIAEVVEDDNTTRRGGVTVTIEKTASARATEATAPAAVTNPVRYTAVSDPDGSYDFNDLPPGVYVVQAKYPGATTEETGEVLVDGRPDGVTLKDIVLRPLTGLMKVAGTAKGETSYTYTATPTVTLELYGFNAVKMKIGRSSNGTAAGCVFGPVETYAATKPYLLPAEGKNTLCAVYVGEDGKETPPVLASIVYDKTPPTASMFQINGGVQFSKSAQLTLQLSSVDMGTGLEAMMLSTRADFAGATEQQFVPAMVYPAPATHGEITLYVKFADRAGNYADPVSATIVVDVTPPTVSLLQLQDQFGEPLAIATNARAYVRLDASDVNPLDMLLSPRADFAGAVWQPYLSPVQWDFVVPTNPAGEMRTVYAKVRDAAGHVRDAGNVSLLLDAIGPSNVAMSFAAATITTSTTGLTFTYSNADWIEISPNASFDPKVRFSAIASTMYTFSPGDGLKSLYARFGDVAGNISPVVSRSLILDTTPPALPFFTVQQGVVTNDPTVNLVLSAMQASEMQISEGSCGGAWESYATAKAYSFATPVNELKSIAVRFRDEVDNRTACLTQTIAFDNVAPQLLANPFQISEGAASTSSAQVNLSFNVTGATELRVSLDASFADTIWVLYSPGRPFTLSALEGSQTVYAQFRDAADNRTAILDKTISVDTVPPEIGIVQINSGASYTANASVEVAVASSGDPVLMNIRDEAGDLYQGAFVAVTTVTLSSGEGPRTLSVKLWDLAYNGSERISRTIELDLQPPRGAILIANGALRSAGESVTLDLSAADDGSGIRGVKLVNEDAINLATALEGSFDATKSWTLAATSVNTEAPKTVWYQVIDKAGNISAPVSDTVVVDKLAPTGSIALSAAVTNQTLVGVDLAFVGDTTHMKLSSGDLCAGGNWVEASTATLWTLAPIDGEKQVSVQFRDLVGNLSACYSANVILDTMGPIPRFLTLTGSGNPLPGFSDSPNITVDYGANAVDCAVAEFAEDVGFINVFNTQTVCTGSTPYIFASTYDGFKNLYLRFLDDLGNAGPITSATIVIESTAPLVEVDGGFTIAEGEWVNNQVVTLQLSAAGATRVRVGEGADCLFSPAPYATTKSLTLSGGDAAKTVSVQYVDDAGNASACYSRMVTLDTFIEPFSIALQGHDGFVIRTASQAVTVTAAGINPADVVEMRVSNLASFTGSSWEPLLTEFGWVLPSGDGTKNLFVAIRDRAGNMADASGSIILDQTPPNAPALQVIDVDGDGFALSTTTVELRWSLPGGASKLELQRFVNVHDNDFHEVAELTAVQTTYVDAITQPGTRHNYRIRAVDFVGNTSDWSIVASALPFEPVTSGDWVRDVDGRYRVYFSVNPGTFTFTGTYQYEDPFGIVKAEALIDNSATFARPVDWSRYFDRFALRTVNADNTLVYETTLPLDIQFREAVDTVGLVGNSSSIALDTSGKAHISYNDQTNYDLKYATNASGAWVMTSVDTAGLVGGYTSLALDAAGKAHISYYDATNMDLKYATNASGGWVMTSVDTTGRVGAQPSLALDGAGKAHITYDDNTNGGLKYATNASGAWVVTTVGVGDDSSLALNAAGKAFISYTDSTTGDLKYATNASGAWVITSVDTVGLVGSHSSIALDSGGKAHISYYDSTNGDLKYATNASGSWVLTSVDTAGDVGQWTSLRLDAAGKANIGYNDITNGGIKYATNVSGTWMTSNLENVGRNPSIALDEDGVAHISYADLTNFDLKYARHAAGSSIAKKLVTGGVAGEVWTSLRLNSSGKVHISYYDDVSDDLMYISNESGSWVATAVDTVGNVGAYSSLALNNAGKAHISYYDQGNGDLKYASNASGVWVLTSVDTVGDVGSHSSIALDSGGNAHISYYDTANGNLKYATNASGEWVLTSVDTAGIVGQYTAITVDSADKVHISYYDSTNGDLKYATNASGVWRATSLDTAGNVGDFTSIAVDANGKLHISYHDATNDDLKYINNTSGTWVATHVDPDGRVGQFTSIAVDTAGKVHISYSDATNKSLKYATNVSGSWASASLEAVDSASTSIALDATGKAHIGYWRVPYMFDLGDVRYATGFNGRLQATQVRQVTAF